MKIPSARSCTVPSSRPSEEERRQGALELTVAEAVCEQLRFNLDAQYLGGYAVECSFKALILEKTPAADRLDMLKKISSGAPMHRPEVLLGQLKEFAVSTSGRCIGAPEEIKNR